MSAVAGCVGSNADQSHTSSEYARYFDILNSSDGTSVVVISPYDGSRDTLKVDEPMDNLICMSSSNVAALSEIGADTLISAVSGIRYISNPNVRSRWESGMMADVGYEASLDYEKILEIKPDLLVAYTVTGAEPPYISKLRSLEVPVLMIHDHMEEHPLARAEYIRLFGALTGRMHKADSAFSSIRERYTQLAAEREGSEGGVKVLCNIPYSDAWYIPGKSGYMSQLIRDAGGEVLGAGAGAASGVISMETAYRLSQEADIWLNPGNCISRKDVASRHRLFPDFGPLSKDRPIYNNTLRNTPEGGNDFWETGAVRPDLILQDLRHIFEDRADSLHFFVRLD